MKLIKHTGVNQLAKVLILTGDAAEALEVFYPYYRLLEEGHEATIAAPKKKRLQTVVHDFEPVMDTFTEKWAYGLESHIAFSDVNAADYDACMIPGGRAPEYIRMEKEVPEIVRHFFETNKPVGAICHAALIFSLIPETVKGRRMTAFTSCRPEVVSAGAEYVNQPLHVDGNLVSAHAWPDLPGFMKEFLKLLK
ncbi:DJ-1/PfpI family protein [Paenactinomyces guangxiensis]|uniref:DJ-1/PfpI family protein n=1 Tax=Paenactinomyces guangxiensis TaxID=1490290 RepID=A0A7W2A8L9_9BACL|nr:DJ-1/PfpI family protein [Paenactinomyces guangxiensis]MBA4494312.1 DJ-1/PfpI family protein [Paenactinomyces guangxiensis]MBH8590806.1 DJ-1/PfpI family protein [Paenactinomyces guangxiensis]